MIKYWCAGCPTVAAMTYCNQKASGKIEQIASIYQTRVLRYDSN